MPNTECQVALGYNVYIGLRTWYLHKQTQKEVNLPSQLRTYNWNMDGLTVGVAQCNLEVLYGNYSALYGGPGAIIAERIMRVSG
jgi:hypothetical protein